MKIKILLLLLLTSFLLKPDIILSQGSNGHVHHIDAHKIKQEMIKMEHFFKKGDMLSVAKFYLDNAYIIGSKDYVITGREQINEYWTSTQNPVDWKLETIILTSEERKMYETSYWRSMKNKPTDWKYLKINTKDVLYQLGTSTISTRNGNKIETHKSDVIILWQKQADGFYEILVDTFVFNE